MEIKAIQTRYNGYLFRSRLEARWAVFFDSLGVAWDYEKEGFELKTGERYLPDFWLPDERIWVEVKGEKPEDDYFKMLKEFSWESGIAVLLVIGIPGSEMYHFWGTDTTESGTAGNNYWDDIDIIDVFQGRIKFSSQSDVRLPSKRTVFSDSGFKNALDFSYSPDRILSVRTVRAINAAKSARFEHLMEKAGDLNESR